MNRSPLTATEDASENELLDLMRSHRKEQIPLINAGGRAIGVVVRADFIEGSLHESPVLLLAGGKAERSLSAERQRAALVILDGLLRQLVFCGFRNISIAVPPNAVRVRDHVADGRTYGARIEYLEEPYPLGTAGALRLMRRDDNPVLIVNGDLVTRIHFGHMMAYHMTSTADATCPFGKHA